MVRYSHRAVKGHMRGYQEMLCRIHGPHVRLPVTTPQSLAATARLASHSGSHCKKTMGYSSLMVARCVWKINSKLTNGGSVDESRSGNQVGGAPRGLHQS